MLPTPWQLVANPISVSILSMCVAVIIWEALRPARKLPPVRGWKLRGLVSFVVFFFISGYLPALLNPLFARFQLFDLTSLNPLVASLAAYVLLQVLVYWWHRAIHRFDALWLGVHQMHHSAERIDSYGAFYLGPGDMIGIPIIGSLCFPLLLGLSPAATTGVILLANFLTIFEHANIRTPRWLGYIIQRPESHTEHHAAGRHQNNYCSLPLIDMLFGTFYNPPGFANETGFYHGASARVKEMLLAKDVSQPRQQQAA